MCHSRTICLIIAFYVRFPNTHAMVVGMAKIRSEAALIAAALTDGTFHDWESRRNDPHEEENDEANQAEWEGWVWRIQKSAEDYECAPEESFISDPILAMISNARRQRDEAERTLKLGIAYARTCERPYSLREISPYAGMAPSTVADYFDDMDRYKAHAIVLEVRKSLSVLSSRDNEVRQVIDQVIDQLWRVSQISSQVSEASRADQIQDLTIQIVKQIHQINQISSKDPERE